MKRFLFVFLWLSLLASCGTPLKSGDAANAQRPDYKISGTSSTGALALERLELAFASGEKSLTVSRHSAITAQANINFRGQGVLQGRWRVNGQVVDQFNVPLHHGNRLTLSTARSTQFPTLDSGQYRIELEILKPQPSFTLPHINYFVTH